VIGLPNSPDFFVSLVTSRLYDGDLDEYAPSAGYPETEYTVYKPQDGKAPLVILGSANAGYGQPIVEGLKASLHTIFMDYDINPNTIPATAVKKR
jgi:hypothetical protein